MLAIAHTRIYLPSVVHPYLDLAKRLAHIRKGAMREPLERVELGELLGQRGVRRRRQTERERDMKATCTCELKMSEE